MGCIVHQIPVGGFDSNFSYVIAEESSRQAFIVDPSGDIARAITCIEEQQLSVIGILLTHTHHDHYDQLGTVTAMYSVPIYVHTSSVATLASYDQVVPLTDGLSLTLGNNHLKVLHTPGHIDDAVCYYIEATEAADHVPKVITGDTLFVGGCGRTSEQRVKDLWESLRELANLPEETTVYPGHDYGDTPTSSIGREKLTNRFYQTKNFNEFARMRLPKTHE